MGNRRGEPRPGAHLEGKRPQLAAKLVASMDTVASAATYARVATLAVWPAVINAAHHVDDEALRQTIADNIRLARKLADLSQAELAHRIGVDRTDISRYEHARRSPQRPTLLRIAIITGQDIGWFYKLHAGEAAA